MHDEAVGLGIGLDDREIGVDGRREGAAGMRLGCQRRGDVGDEVGGDAASDGDVQVILVGEVAVDAGLARARLGGDVLHADGRAVATDGPDGGLDELGSTGGPVPLPPPRTAVRLLPCAGRRTGLHALHDS